MQLCGEELVRIVTPDLKEQKIVLVVMLSGFCTSLTA